MLISGKNIVDKKKAPALLVLWEGGCQIKFALLQISELPFLNQITLFLICHFHDEFHCIF